MQTTAARMAGALYISALYVFLPLMPLMVAIAFGRRKYLVNYRQTLRKTHIHIAALRQGPAVHFFQDVWGQPSQVPQHIQGECIQCGNCCMHHQCMFLEQMPHNKYGCGIYHSPLRRLSNCSSFPLNSHDIERYACPSYFVGYPKARVISIVSVP